LRQAFKIKFSPGFESRLALMFNKAKTMYLLKRNIKLLVPPLITAILKRITSKLKLRSPKEIENAYSNREFLNYYFDSGEIRRRQLESGQYLNLNEITPGLALSLMDKKSTINVLDFGGGTGNLFHAIRHFLPAQKFVWNVVETPELVNRIFHSLKDEELEFGDSSLRFFSSIDQVLAVHPRIDIVIAASSVQYTNNPYETLASLINVGAKTIHISRMPFIQNERLLIFQQKSRIVDNGPQTGIQNSKIWVSTTVRIPNLVEFQTQFAKNFPRVTTMLESPNGYPDSELVIPLYSIIGQK
jgi:putative methyltransferase (TIGR04325 family)